MANPDLILIPFAQDGDKNTIPLELGIGDPVYRASLKAGFPPDTRIPKDIGGEPPDGLDFNGVLNILSQAVVFLQKGNAYQFDVSMAPYPIGALVRSNDDLTTFQNTIALNSNNPNTNMSGWRVYNGSGFIVDNLTTNDSAKALSAAQGKALQDNKLEANKVGVANGVASLDANTRVPVAQLPNASTTAIGAVQLNDTLTSSSVVQALTANQGNVLAGRDIGYNQTWQNVTSSRVAGTTYTNSTTKPIVVLISLSVTTYYTGVFTLNNLPGLPFGHSAGQGTAALISVIIPPGSTYSCNIFTYWLELR